MKKIYIVVLLASFLYGDIVKHTEIEASAWRGESSKTFQAKGDVVDLGDMGSVDGTTPSVAVDIQTISNKPNVKLQYTKINNEDTTVLTKDLTYNDAHLYKNEKVKTTYDADIWDFILYKNIQNTKPTLDLDLGMGLRYIDSSLELKECSKESKSSFKEYTPILYARADYGVEKNNLALIGQLIYSPIDKQHIDLKTAVGYDYNKKIRAELGYRFLKVEPDDNNIKSDIVTKGAYIGLTYSY